MRNIQNWHMDHNGWADIGYNFLVDRYGTIWEGRGWGALGAHCKGHNSDYLGIAYMGEDDVTPAALGAIAWLLEMARTRHRVGPAVKPHNALGSTSCPGPRLTTWVTPAARSRRSAPANPGPSPSREAHPTTVSLGARGPVVGQLQRALNAKKARLDRALVVDSVFGPKTKAAVIRFQRRQKISADGIVGPITWARLGY